MVEAGCRRWLIISVPREPIWRILNLARLRYATSLGNTPGHVQHWSSRRFVALVSEFADVRAVLRPLPWTVLLAHRVSDSRIKAAVAPGATPSPFRPGGW